MITLGERGSSTPASLFRPPWGLRSERMDPAAEARSTASKDRHDRTSYLMSSRATIPQQLERPATSRPTSRCVKNSAEFLCRSGFRTLKRSPGVCHGKEATHLCRCRDPYRRGGRLTVGAGLCLRPTILFIRGVSTSHKPAPHHAGARPHSRARCAASRVYN